MHSISTTINTIKTMCHTDLEQGARTPFSKFALKTLRCFVNKLGALRRPHDETHEVKITPPALCSHNCLLLERMQQTKRDIHGDVGGQSVSDYKKRLSRDDMRIKCEFEISRRDQKGQKSATPLGKAKSLAVITKEAAKRLRSVTTSSKSSESSLSQGAKLVSTEKMACSHNAIHSELNSTASHGWFGKMLGQFDIFMDRHYHRAVGGLAHTNSGHYR